MTWSITGWTGEKCRRRGAPLPRGIWPAFSSDLALGLVTAVSGYTAVYALNDVVDYRVDRGKMQEAGGPAAQGDLDSVFVRSGPGPGHGRLGLHGGLRPE